MVLIHDNPLSFQVRRSCMLNKRTIFCQQMTARQIQLDGSQMQHVFGYFEARGTIVRQWLRRAESSRAAAGGGKQPRIPRGIGSKLRAGRAMKCQLIAEDSRPGPADDCNVWALRAWVVESS